MPFKTSLTFTYDCGEFEKGMDLALKMADCGGLRQAQGGIEEERQAARPRHVEHHRARRGGEPRGRRNPLRPRRHGADLLRQHQPGPGPRDHVQAGGGRQARHASGRHRVHPGRHRQGVLRRRHRRLALGHHVGLGVLQRRRKGHRQGQGDRRAQPQGRCRRHQLQRGHLLQHQDQPDHDHQGRGAGRVQPGEAAEGHGGRPVRHRGLQGRRRELPERRAHLRGRGRSRRPARSRW